jgi:hypothetical protein
MKRQISSALWMRCPEFVRNLLGIAAGLSSVAAVAGDVPPPPAEGVAPPKAIQRFSSDYCLPEFSMPAASPSQSFLNENTSAAPISTPAQSFGFGGGLAGNTLLASSYAPAMIGDFFGMSSNGGAAQFAGHFDAYLDGTPNPGFNFNSGAPYSGSLTGTLDIEQFSPEDADTTISGFTTNVTTLLPQNGGVNGAYGIQNNQQVQSLVANFAASILGPGFLVPGYIEGGDTTGENDRNFYIDENNPTMAYANWGYDYYNTIVTPGGTIAAAPGANIGRQKLSENTSPIPRDRVFINYNYFNNTPLAPGGVNVNRVTPGFEKTFFDGRMSFEMRAPFATTLDNTVDINGLTNSKDTEFGNLTMYFKALLWQTQRLAFSTGLGVTAPTAQDFAFVDNGTQVVRVDNESVHLLPFFAVLYTPNSRLFAQAMMQFDVDANGNPVSVSGFDSVSGTYTGDLVRIGRPYDYTYMYLDFNVGYWTYLAPNSGRFITGFAPMFEVHVNQTVGAASATRAVVDGVPWQFTSPGSLSSVNATVGANMILLDRATLTLGYGTPIGGTDQFDGEFRLSFNWLFGNSRPNNPLTRVNTF